MTDPISNERLVEMLAEVQAATAAAIGEWPYKASAGVTFDTMRSILTEIQSRRQSPAGVAYEVQHNGEGYSFTGNASPPPKAVIITDEMVERAAEAVAKSWGETWRCDCSEKRGLDCDCGSAMTDEREQYDERLSREDCRMASRAALTAALSSEAHNGREVE